MPNSDLLQALIDEADLTPRQAQGLLGVLLRKLKEKLSPADYQQVVDIVPDPENCIEAAPKTGGGFLGGLAGLGGEKAKLLLEMNQAFRALGIPADRAQTIGETLQAHVEARHPDLVAIFTNVI